MKDAAAGGAPAGRVSAVVVHFRTPEETVRAVRALASADGGPEVLVVDNDSRDRIGERLASAGLTARVLTLPENRGYGAACNAGARQTDRPCLLFLNSDARMRPGSVAALVEALEADSGAAAVGPRLENPDGSLQPSIRRLPTPWRIFCESSGLAALAGGRAPFSGHAATREDHARAAAVEALMGAALLVRRSDFEAAGGFDEAFFLYAEETDLMARWRARGRRILYEPRASAVHLGGASGGDALFGQLHASLSRYAAKHHGRIAAAFVRGALAGGAALRYAAAVVTPGERGRRRRARYRAALSGAAR